MVARTFAILAGCVSCSALNVRAPASVGTSSCRAATTPAMRPPLAFVAPAAASSATARVAAAVRMQEPALDFYDEYVETDPVTGEKKTLQLEEKEKLYLECLDAYYNEDGKQILSNEEYEQLKLDLDFDGSTVATYSKDEIRFVLANKRFKMGKPFLDDKAYDELREKLRVSGSLVVLHDEASCNPDSGLCKTDLRVDSGKTRLLYLPGAFFGLLIIMEGFFWTVGLDPIFSAVFASLPAYFFSIWFTENVFAQKPLVVQATCPDCTFQFNVFFGDLFAVQQDGIVPPKGPSPSTIDCKCPSCKVDLEADRDKMLIITKNSKIPAKA